MIQVQTINDVIRLSYFLTSSFTFEHVPSADEISFGLTILNLILRTDPTGEAVPFYQNISFTCVPDQEMYTFAPAGTLPPPDVISNRIVDISTAVMILNKVRYPIKPLNRYEFNGLTNREIVSSIPRSWFFENTIPDVSQFYLYPKPNQDYGCEIQAKTDLDLLTLYTPITQVPQYYQYYLVYALAKELMNYRPSGVWNNDKEMRYQQLRQLIIAAADTDLTIITKESRQFRNHGAITIFTGGI